MAEGTSPTTGPYIVEDTETSVNNESCKVRRLYFTSNPNVIQSESFLDADGRVDRQKLAFEYHWQLCSGLLLTSDIVDIGGTAELNSAMKKALNISRDVDDTTRIIASKSKDVKALVIGLGGTFEICFCCDCLHI